MPWPTTGAGTLANGYLATGVTTIVWGTNGVLTNVGGITGVGVVTRFSQKTLADVIKLPQGDGLTSTRVMIVDGMQWDFTVRDDTRMTVRPRVGNTVLILDGAGYFSLGLATSSSYIATIVDVNYEVAPKQAAEFHLTVENLILFSETQNADTSVVA